MPLTVRLGVFAAIWLCAYFSFPWFGTLTAWAASSLASSVVTVPLRVTVAPHIVELPAEIEPMQIDLRSPEKAPISQVFVKEGEAVFPGKPLARIDSTLLERRLESKVVELQVVRKRCNLIREQILRAINEPPTINFDYVVPLEPAFVWEASFEFDLPASTSFILPRSLLHSELVASLATAERLQAEIKDLRSQIEGTVIRSPVRGFVLTTAHQGEIAGDDKSIVSIMDSSNAIVAFRVSGARAARFDGATQLRIKSGRGSPIQGQISSIGPVDEHGVSEIRGTFAITNPHSIRPGNSAIVRFLEQSGVRARVPSEAIVHSGERAAALFVAVNGVLHRMEFELDASTGEALFDSESLDDGDLIALHPAGLVDGQPIRDLTAVRELNCLTGFVRQTLWQFEHRRFSDMKLPASCFQ